MALSCSLHPTVPSEGHPPMDGEKPLHGGAGRAPGTPQPCQPHRSAPLALAVGPELGASESPASTEGQSLAQGRCSGGRGQNSWHKAGGERPPCSTSGYLVS